MSPPLYRQTRQLTVLLKQAVMRFSRYHKHSAWADLRCQAIACWRLAHRAVHGEVRAGQARHWRHDTRLRTVGEWFLPAPAGGVELEG
jgi:hypothetical protein